MFQFKVAVYAWVGVISTASFANGLVDIAQKINPTNSDAPMLQHVSDNLPLIVWTIVSAVAVLTVVSRAIKAIWALKATAEGRVRELSLEVVKATLSEYSKNDTIVLEALKKDISSLSNSASVIHSEVAFLKEFITRSKKI